jgi:AcrR family transcriptional regulator
MLLEAAREAFVSMGYHGAGMDAIADIARVSKPVLYQHFPGKLELYLAVLDESTESLVAAVRTALGSTHDNARRVQATIEAYFAFVADDSAAFKLIFESDLTNEPEVGRRVSRANEMCAEMISAVIAQDTDLGQEEAMILGTGLTGLAQTAARHWLATGSLISQKAAARDLYQLAWRGISGFPLTHPPVPKAGSDPDPAGGQPTEPGAGGQPVGDPAPDPSQTPRPKAGNAPKEQPHGGSNRRSGRTPGTGTGEQ